MTFGEAIRACLSQYVTFSGRARRSEFWYFALFTFLTGSALSLVDSATFGTGPEDAQVFSSLFSLAIFLPTLSVAVRRLHDLDRSGWWWWLWLLPIIGWIILLIWNASKGTDGANQYGADPFGEDFAGHSDRMAATHASSIPKVSRHE